MMAIPLSAIRKYTPEIVALSVVAIVLGAFWSIVDTYQPPYLLELQPSNASVVNATNSGVLNATESPFDIITEAPKFQIDSPDAVANATNATNPVEDNEFALGAPKAIKFAQTGTFTFCVN